MSVIRFALYPKRKSIYFHQLRRWVSSPKAIQYKNFLRAQIRFCIKSHIVNCYPFPFEPFPKQYPLRSFYKAAHARGRFRSCCASLKICRSTGPLLGLNAFFSGARLARLPELARSLQALLLTRQTICLRPASLCLYAAPSARDAIRRAFPASPILHASPGAAAAPFPSRRQPPDSKPSIPAAQKRPERQPPFRALRCFFRNPPAPF